MTRKILLLGKNGQVGSALHGYLAAHGSVIAHSRETCELTDHDRLRSVIREAQPDIVINAAAYTAVDQAETDERACRAINSDAPGIIAEEAKRLRAALIHYSTNYVYDGAKAGAYLEGDEANPLNVYGQCKLDGDRAIIAVGGPYVILRVGWIYSLHGRNFANSILRLAAQRDELTIVADQYGTPTSADFVARISATIVGRHIVDSSERTELAPGIYNLAPAGRTSWHGFATELVGEMRRLGHVLRVSEDRIIPIAAKDRPAPARRPVNSLLGTGKLQRALGLSIPQWNVDVGCLAATLASSAQMVRAAGNRAASSDHLQSS
jgi:dTDP-4-dehydrorhamnose reductase